MLTALYNSSREKIIADFLKRLVKTHIKRLKLGRASSRNQNNFAVVLLQAV